MLEKLTFADYGEEGLFVMNLVNSEANPYLICSLEEVEMHYRLWDSETDITEDECWYQKDIDKLKLIVRFHTQKKLHQMECMVFEITNKQSVFKYLGHGFS